MELLRSPRREEFVELNEATRLNQQEKRYIDDMSRRKAKLFRNDDYQGMIEFNENELEATKGKFGNRVAIKRILEYNIALGYEFLGEHDQDLNHEEREDMFLKAAIWHQQADETVGYLTLYGLRQAHSYIYAAHFRREAGLDDCLAEEFSRMGGRLIQTCINGNKRINGPDKNILDYLNDIVDQKVRMTVEAYMRINQKNVVQ